MLPCVASAAARCVATTARSVPHVAALPVLSRATEGRRGHQKTSTTSTMTLTGAALGVHFYHSTIVARSRVHAGAIGPLRHGGAVSSRRAYQTSTLRRAADGDESAATTVEGGAEAEAKAAAGASTTAADAADANEDNDAAAAAESSEQAATSAAPARELSEEEIKKQQYEAEWAERFKEMERVLRDNLAAANNPVVPDRVKEAVYQLHAKDPARWTVLALSQRYGFRKERIAAWIRFKEMEKATLAQPGGDEALIVDAEERVEAALARKFGVAETSDSDVPRLHKIEVNKPSYSYVDYDVDVEDFKRLNQKKRRDAPAEETDVAATAVDAAATAAANASDELAPEDDPFCFEVDGREQSWVYAGFEDADNAGINERNQRLYVVDSSPAGRQPRKVIVRTEDNRVRMATRAEKAEVLGSLKINAAWGNRKHRRSPNY